MTHIKRVGSASRFTHHAHDILDLVWFVSCRIALQHSNLMQQELMNTRTQVMLASCTYVRRRYLSRSGDADGISFSP